MCVSILISNKIFVPKHNFISLLECSEDIAEITRLNDQAFIYIMRSWPLFVNSPPGANHKDDKTSVVDETLKSPINEITEDPVKEKMKETNSLAIIHFA